MESKNLKHAVFLCAATLICALLSAAALAEEPARPPYYAIENVRVVSGAGAPVDGATVLIADGLIAAVGTAVDVPADAWVVDGEGLTLFPGLIDAMTTMGQKQESDSGGRPGGGFGGGGPTIRGPEDRPGTTPWVAVADELADDARVEKWREAGFTAAMSSPTDGLFAGQAALINLGGSGEMRERVVATPVAQRVNFRGSGGFRSFPGSLMGGLSYIKQVLSDTRHYAESKALYASSPLGRERPAHDRALEPLEMAFADSTPSLMPAQRAREIDRVLKIRAEFDVPTVIYGGQGAYERTAALKASKTAVLVSLDWPEEEKDRDPESDTPFRTLFHRRMAPTTPAALAAAGVDFALYSDTLSSTSAIFEKIRTAVDAGLSDEDALAALTSGAARIFGVDDRLGTIEPGKIANLVLATDWPWAKDSEIEAVFVDGRKYDYAEEEEEGDPPASDVSGTWEATMQSPRGARDMTLELEMAEDGKVSGELSTDQGDTSLDDGRMSGDLLRFKTTRSMGGRSFTASWSLTVDGEKVEGTMSAGPMSMEISGERTAKPEDGDKEEEAEEQDEVTLDELREALALYQGPVEKTGDFAVTNATVWTVSGETIENGTVVVKDGKIAAVGTDVKIPRRAKIVDAAGGALIPGIIDAHSHIAVDGGVNEGSIAVSSMVGIEDVLNPDDIGIYRALAGGVTSANILHGSANPIGGKNAVVKLRWGAEADDLLIADAMPGIKFALGENPKRSNFRGAGMPQRYPQTRMGVMDVIRQAFTEAREYQKEWDAYEKAKGSAMPPRRDLKLEPLVEILEGKRLVHSHCYRADEILQLLRLAEEFGFRVATLQHVLEGYKVADEIAAHGAGASTFSDWWGYKVEAYDAIPHNAALMAERGVLVSINSDSGEEMRHLNQEAAKAVKWGGMDEVAALATVTLNPAKQFRIDDRVGSIEVGKDADLVLYDGHPLSIRSVVQKTWVDGDLYFDREADRERQAGIDAIKKRLLGTGEDDEDEDGEDGGSAPPEVRWHDETTYSCREVH
jgi:imidazolonepropionase-like amidohydrolase